MLGVDISIRYVGAVVELAVLGVLREGDLHGYELRKRVRELLGPGSSVSFGSLYPALARLERGGLVREVEPDDSGGVPIPMTGSLSGELAAFRARSRRRPRTPRGARTRKVFGVTAAGEARLAELVAEPGEDDRAFAVKLALCRWCDPATRLALFERRRAALTERLAAVRRSAAGSSGPLDRYRRSLVEREADVTERDLVWLDGLIAGELDPDPRTPEPSITGGTPS
jgi:DNA-binding PadR family transcriptional regulator